MIKKGGKQFLGPHSTLATDLSQKEHQIWSSGWSCVSWPH